MSYARFGPESDVYVFAHIAGGFCCCGCMLNGEQMYDNQAGMLDHLQRHIKAGHNVPARTLERLNKEINDGSF